MVFLAMEMTLWSCHLRLGALFILQETADRIGLSGPGGRVCAHGRRDSHVLAQRAAAMRPLDV